MHLQYSLHQAGGSLYLKSNARTGILSTDCTKKGTDLAILLRYKGTDLAYGAPVSRYGPNVCCYRYRGTDLAYAATAIR
eukprot:744282-Rhodomonas_salina.1